MGWGLISNHLFLEWVLELYISPRMSSFQGFYNNFFYAKTPRQKLKIIHSGHIALSLNIFHLTKFILGA